MRYGLIILLCACLSFRAQAIDIVSHRGFAGLLPENTLAAMEAALVLGVDVIDVDVVLSADDELMVSHDAYLNPDFTQLENGQWLPKALWIRELSQAALDQFNVGGARPGSSYAEDFPQQHPLPHAALPTLREVLTLIAHRAPGHALQIEIKTHPSQQRLAHPIEIVPQLVETLRTTHIGKHIQVHSFDWRNLVLLRQWAPEVTLSFLTDFSNPDWEPGLWTAGIELASPEEAPAIIAELGGEIWCPNYQTLTPALVEKAHQHGLRVQPWTVDNPTDMRRLIDYGVDAIITNRPDVLKGVLAAHAVSQAA